MTYRAYANFKLPPLMGGTLVARFSIGHFGDFLNAFEFINGSDWNTPEFRLAGCSLENYFGVRLTMNLTVEPERL